MVGFLLFCIIVFAGSYVLAVIIPEVSDIARRRGTSSVLDRIARRFHGVVIRNRKVKPYVLARIKGRPYRIEVRDLEQPLLTISTVWDRELSVSFDVGESQQETENNFRMSISPERSWRGLTDVKDIEVGNTEFDELFLIQANDEEILLGTLTRQCQDLIQQIYRPTRDGKFEIRVVGNELQMDLRVRLSRPAKIFTAIRNFAELHIFLVQANEVADAIEIEVVELTGQATCLICGELVREPTVQCGSCRTQYHKDCWEYVGRCGRYACGESDGMSSEPSIFSIEE